MRGNYFTLPKAARITKWQRLLLCLLPTYAWVESPVVVFYKMWRGVVYVVGEEPLPELKNV